MMIIMVVMRWIVAKWISVRWPSFKLHSSLWMNGGFLVSSSATNAVGSVLYSTWPDFSAVLNYYLFTNGNNNNTYPRWSRRLFLTFTSLLHKERNGKSQTVYIRIMSAENRISSRWSARSLRIREKNETVIVSEFHTIYQSSFSWLKFYFNKSFNLF